VLLINTFQKLQPIEAGISPEIFLKVALSATFKNISGFAVGAKRCSCSGFWIRVL